MGRLVLVGGAQQHLGLLQTAANFGELPFEFFGLLGTAGAHLFAQGVEYGVRDSVLQTGNLVGQVVEGLHQRRTTTSKVPSWYWARSTFLSNLPTLVLGMVSKNVQFSGNHHLATRSAKKSRNSSGLAVMSGRSTTQHSGRSCHFSSGTATTAASKTAGWAIMVLSRVTELIHSPPDLMTSLVRSLMTMKPSGSRVPMSPVRSQKSTRLNS